MELDEKGLPGELPRDLMHPITPRYQSANDNFDNQRQLKICVSITKIKISEATTTSNTVVIYTTRILATCTINATYASFWP